MPKEDWIKNSIDTIFRRNGLYPERKIETVLDVACGISFKSQYIRNVNIRVGIDIYRPYLENIEIERNVPYVLINEDIRNIENIFLPKSFDMVLLLDIIEHIDKDEAIELIKKCENIAKVAVVIETPNGYIPQNIDILGYGGHEFQTHKCGWDISELNEMGYSTLLRNYVMSDKKRHTDIEVQREIQLIDAIKEL